MNNIYALLSIAFVLLILAYFFFEIVFYVSCSHLSYSVIVTLLPIIALLGAISGLRYALDFLRNWIGG